MKFEKRIGLRCHQWLYLGGRFVLLKSVLKSLLVYWLAVAIIHTSILNRIRQLMYNFLWSSSGERECLHLCKWEKIAKPKSFGGWGVSEHTYI
jgi:hypothetical protein